MKKLFDEEVSKPHKNDVLAAARKEMQGHKASVFEQLKQAISELSSLRLFVSSMAFSFLAFISWRAFQQNSKNLPLILETEQTSQQDSLALLDVDPELLENMELFEDLEFWESLDEDLEDS